MPDDGGINMPRATRIGWVAQEAPGGPDSLIDFVLAADKERARLLAEAETAHDPGRIADIHERLADIGAHAAPVARGAHPGRPRLRRGGPAAPLRGVLRRLAHARGAGRHAVHRARPAAARRAHQLPRPRGHAVARGLPARLPPHRADRQPRPRAAQPLRRLDPAPGPGQAHALHRRLRPVRGGAAREAAPRPQAQEEAGRRAPPHRGVHHPLQGQGLQGQRRRRAASRRWRACSRSPSRSRSGWRRSCSPTRPRRSPAR